MNNKTFSFSYSLVSFEELDDSLKELVRTADEAAKNAYAPYSNFHVGAGVLLSSGEIVTSTNQESEAYPSGICAERSLLYYVQANHMHNTKTIKAMAINACPCGACRQVMIDTEKRNEEDIKIIFPHTDGLYYIIYSAKNLLPFNFNL